MVTSTTQNELEHLFVVSASDVTTIRVQHGVPKDALPPLLADPDGWIIFDLRSVDDAEATARTVAAAVASGGRREGRTCLVASTRRLGRGAASIAVFTSSADAYQAKLFFEAGIGRGWGVA